MPPLTDPQKPSPKKESAGPIVGIIIIIIMMLLGALYFWGALLNKQDQKEPLPFITGETSTIPSP